MKHILVVLLSAFCLCASAFAGAIDIFTYTYPTDPTGVSTNSLNPPPGAVIITGSSGRRATKLSARGSNAVYASQLSILNSGTAAITLSGTVAQTLTLVSLPSTSGTFVFTSADIIVTGTSGVTAAPTFILQSGTANLLSGTTTLGTTANTNTHVALAGNPMLLSGTTIELRTIVTGTATSITGKAFIHGFFLP